MFNIMASVPNENLIIWIGLIAGILSVLLGAIAIAITVILTNLDRKNKYIEIQGEMRSLRSNFSLISDSTKIIKGMAISDMKSYTKKLTETDVLKLRDKSLEKFVSERTMQISESMTKIRKNFESIRTCKKCVYPWIFFSGYTKAQYDSELKLFVPWMNDLFKLNNIDGFDTFIKENETKFTYKKCMFFINGFIVEKDTKRIELNKLYSERADEIQSEKKSKYKLRGINKKIRKLTKNDYEIPSGPDYTGSPDRDW